MDRGAWRATVHGVAKSRTAEQQTFSLLLLSKLKHISVSIYFLKKQRYVNIVICRWLLKTVPFSDFCFN